MADETVPKEHAAVVQPTPSAWLIRVGDKEHRAPNLGVLQQWCRERRVPRDAFVYHSSNPEWMRADTVPGLRDAFQPSEKSFVGMWIGAIALILTGALLSATVIGGCIGIPMMLGGFALMIVGAIRFNKQKSADLQRSVERGIVAGMQAQQQISCPTCGTSNSAASRFCSSCGGVIRRES